MFLFLFLGAHGESFAQRKLAASMDLQHSIAMDKPTVLRLAGTSSRSKKPTAAADSPPLCFIRVHETGNQGNFETVSIHAASPMRVKTGNSAIDAYDVLVSNAVCDHGYRCFCYCNSLSFCY